MSHAFTRDPNSTEEIMAGLYEERLANELDNLPHLSEPSEGWIECSMFVDGEMRRVRLVGNEATVLDQSERDAA